LQAVTNKQLFNKSFNSRVNQPFNQPPNCKQMCPQENLHALIQHAKKFAHSISPRIKNPSSICNTGFTYGAFNDKQAIASRQNIARQRIGQKNWKTGLKQQS
jgi:hypothetical protein